MPTNTINLESLNIVSYLSSDAYFVEFLISFETASEINIICKYEDDYGLINKISSGITL